MKTDDEEDDAFKTQMAELQVPPSERSATWMQKRREFHGKRRTALDDRKAHKKGEELSLAKKIRQHLDQFEGYQKALDAVQLSEFTQVALARLRAKEDAEESNQEIAHDSGPAAASGQGDGDHDAKQNYQAYFFAGSDRTSKDGSFGASYSEPPCKPEQVFWTDDQWAKHFLMVGGFESSVAGAEAEDKDGWLALHHCIQATVHWSYGIAACRGLIEMMSPDRLRAKTRAGRPPGYTALHLAANGSDKIFGRASLVKRLLERGAEVNATDDQLRTPLLLAAGTGVVDAARELIEGRADLAARDINGKNAMDKCIRSSGRMSECPPPSPLPSPASVTVQYSRHVRWR